MSRLVFSRANNQIQLISASGAPLAGPYVAYNNVDMHSNGPWPNGGPYAYIGYNAHPELDDPDSEYGMHGILIFRVPGRSGMGAHSGRANIPDGRGRIGPQHCTLGCIRTTDVAMATFLADIVSDALTAIMVEP